MRVKPEKSDGKVDVPKYRQADYERMLNITRSRPRISTEQPFTEDVMDLLAGIDDEEWDDKTVA